MDYLTVKETATLLRVSPITIRRYIASGKLPAERVGRGIRVRRAAIDRFVVPAISSAVPQHEGDGAELLTINEQLGGIVGIGRSKEPSNIAELKDEYIADAILASFEDDEESEVEDELGQPFTMDDPLWDIVGMGRSGEPNDVARNKHQALADAIMSRKFRSE